MKKPVVILSLCLALLLFGVGAVAESAERETYISGGYTYALLEDGLPDEKLCLCKGDSGEWSVYYSERGKKRGLVRFASEQEACCYLWEKLKRYAGNG